MWPNHICLCRSNGQVERSKKKENRVTVNGDGKTSLDGNCGRLGTVLRSTVNNGHGINNAKSCLSVFETGTCIRGTTLFIFDPIQDVVLETGEKCLAHYSMLKQKLRRGQPAVLPSQWLRP